MHTIKKLLLTTAIASVLTPTISLCAMEKPMRSPEEQQALDMQLWRATDKGELDAVRVALDNGANIDAQDTWEYTALYKAVVQAKRYKNPEITLALLAAKANPNLDVYGSTPLMVAAYDKNPKITIELLKLKVNPNQLSRRGQTALVNATRNENTEVMQALIKARADVDLAGACFNLPDKIYTNSPLQTAVKTYVYSLSGNLKATRILLAAGADFSTLDKQRLSSFDLLRIEKTIKDETDTRDKIRERLAPQVMFNITQYLLDKPLPIDPLVSIFTEYVAGQILVPDAYVRAQRNAETIAEWEQEEAKKAQADKKKDDEHKDDQE
jgi:hypothetical protein